MHPIYVSHDNLDSVNLLIMWDSQGESLAQGCLSHVACQELSRRQLLTNDANIRQHLLPALEVLLMVMLKPAHMSLADMDAFAEAVVQIHNFFTCFDWERTWASHLVSNSLTNPGCIRYAHAICVFFSCLPHYALFVIQHMHVAVSCLSKLLHESLYQSVCAQPNILMQYTL